MSDNMNRTGQSRIINALDAKRTYPSEEHQNVKEQPKEEKYKIEQYINNEAEPLNKFNWGACLLPPIWGLCNKSPITCLIILLGFIPYIGILFVLGFSIYCGIKGNEWAWTNKEWVDMRQFHEIQKKWAIAGIIYTIVSIFITCISVIAIFGAIFNLGSAM